MPDTLRHDGGTEFKIAPRDPHIRTWKCGRYIVSGAHNIQRCAFPTLSDYPITTMTSSHSTNDSESSSIFENGRLRQGIYKIQNLASETYLDILKHSREACCRPSRDLEPGGGLVRLHLSSQIYVSNDSKWEIKSFGIGYTVRRVRLLIKFSSWCHLLSGSGSGCTGKI